MTAATVDAVRETLVALQELCGQEAAQRVLLKYAPCLQKLAEADRQNVIEDARRLLPSRFRPVSVGDFCIGSEPEWIIDGVLPRSELAVGYGEAGSGKSFWILDAVLAVARGVPWRGIATAQGKAVYVCAESPAGFRKRLHAYAQHTEIKLADLNNAMYLIGNAPNLLEAQEVEELLGELKVLGPLAIVVLDTLSRCTPGANENSGEDMGLALRHAQQIHKQTGALVILIHHSGKDAARGARGWSGIRAAADAEIEITRRGPLHLAEVTKQRDGEDGRVFGFKLPLVSYGVDAEGRELSSLVVEPVDTFTPGTREKPPTSPVQLAVWQALKEGPLALDDLLTRAASKFSRATNKRDRRREFCQRAVDALSVAGRITLCGDMVSLAGTASEAEFNDESGASHVEPKNKEDPSWPD